MQVLMKREQKMQQGKQDRMSSDKSNIREIMISGHTAVMEVSDTKNFTVCIHTHTNTQIIHKVHCAQNIICVSVWKIKFDKLQLSQTAAAMDIND